MAINNTDHPYNNRDVYNFFFHPLHFNKTNEVITPCSIAVNIALSIITVGIWQAVFWGVNRCDDAELRKWKKQKSQDDGTTHATHAVATANLGVSSPAQSGKNDQTATTNPQHGQPQEVPTVPLQPPVNVQPQPLVHETAGKGGEHIQFPRGGRCVKFFGREGQEEYLDSLKQNVGLHSNFFNPNNRHLELTVSPRPYKKETINFKTVEQLFHYQKALHLKAFGTAREITELTGTNKDVSDQARQKTQEYCAQTGDDNFQNILEAWDQESTLAMANGLVQKYAPDTYMGQQLAALPDRAVIVENTQGQLSAKFGHDEIWGNGGNDMGRNRQGILLMIIKALNKNKRGLDPQAIAKICADLEKQYLKALPRYGWSTKEQNDIIVRAMDTNFPNGW